MKGLGSAIRRRRKSNNMTQESLAHKAGIHRTYVSLLERGEKCPTVRILKQVSEVFGCPAWEIVRDAESLESESPGS